MLDHVFDLLDFDGPPSMGALFSTSATSTPSAAGVGKQSRLREKSPNEVASVGQGRTICLEYAFPSKHPDRATSLHLERRRR